MTTERNQVIEAGFDMSEEAAAERIELALANISGLTVTPMADRCTMVLTATPLNDTVVATVMVHANEAGWVKAMVLPVQGFHVAPVYDEILDAVTEAIDAEQKRKLHLVDVIMLV